MIDVLYIDEQICVINKASGQVVHKTRGAGDSPVILQNLRDQVGKKIFPVHRLDRGTSGCLAFAFSSETASKLQVELQSDSAIKKYTALCLGQLEPQGTIDRELTNENKVKQRAHTQFRVIQELDGLSLLELQIFTGRKNQIRRHLSFEGHHIVGDVQYGKGWFNRRFREKYEFSRLFLHCHHLSFLHPITGQRMNINCDLPEDLATLLLKLQQNCSEF